MYVLQTSSKIQQSQFIEFNYLILMETSAHIFIILLIISEALNSLL
jgi:hypothetical protein